MISVSRAIAAAPPAETLPAEFRNLPVGIDEARRVQSRFYWAGACRKNHPGPHYTKNLQCVICARLDTQVRAEARHGSGTRPRGMIGKVKTGQPFVHVLSDWSPVMVNIGPLLVARRRDEATA